MNPNPKSTEAPPEPPGTPKPEGRETPPAVAFATLFHKGVVRFAEMEKNALDHLVQHNTDFQNTWTQIYKAPSAPAMDLLDLAVQGIEKFAAVQKRLMDLAVEQSAMVMNISKEGIDGTAKDTSLADIVHQSTDRLIDAEKTVLDFAADQNTLVTSRMKKMGLTDSPPAKMAAETFRRGMDAVIETQKEMIDMAAKPVKADANAAHKATA